MKLQLEIYGKLVCPFFSCSATFIFCLNSTHCIFAESKNFEELDFCCNFINFFIIQLFTYFKKKLNKLDFRKISMIFFLQVQILCRSILRLVCFALCEKVSFYVQCPITKYSFVYLGIVFHFLILK